MGWAVLGCIVVFEFCPNTTSSEWRHQEPKHPWHEDHRVGADPSWRKSAWEDYKEKSVQSNADDEWQIGEGEEDGEEPIRLNSRIRNMGKSWWAQYLIEKYRSGRLWHTGEGLKLDHNNVHKINKASTKPFNAWPWHTDIIESDIRSTFITVLDMTEITIKCIHSCMTKTYIISIIIIHWFCEHVLLVFSPNIIMIILCKCNTSIQRQNW